MTITLQIPDNTDIQDREVFMLIAGGLYEKGKLSLGQAADVAGLSKTAFAELLGFYNFSLFNYPVSDLKRDIANA